MGERASRIRRANTWVEISAAALRHNIGEFRSLAGPERRLAAIVKADAYGHGLIDVSREALRGGADWLGVFWAGEGLALREAGIEAPILVLGDTFRDLLPDAVRSGLRLTVPSLEAVRRICGIESDGTTLVHLKLETGTNRQGLLRSELPEAVRLLRSRGVEIEGVYTHFADIEDTTDHAFAEHQRRRFSQLIEHLAELGLDPPIRHTACSAAAILFPETYLDLVRVGIALYGLWPSKETFVSASLRGREAVELHPVMSWKTRVAQIKEVPGGDYVGYGRTYRATRETRLAVLPIGYADGYDRRLSNSSHVLVRGVRAPVRGRVCMNLTMVDVTDVPGAVAGDEVVLLGRQGDERIAAEHLAALAGTINYELVTRAAPGAPRLVV
jgi:alanine racemase